MLLSPFYILPCFGGDYRKNGEEFKCFTMDLVDTLHNISTLQPEYSKQSSTTNEQWREQGIVSRFPL